MDGRLGTQAAGVYSHASQYLLHIAVPLAPSSSHFSHLISHKRRSEKQMFTRGRIPRVVGISNCVIRSRELKPLGSDTNVVNAQHHLYYYYLGSLDKLRPFPVLINVR